MSTKIKFIIVIFITAILSYNLINQIVNTLKSGDKLQEATEKLHQLEIKNKELKSKLGKVKTPEFIEQQARDKLGLSKEGETLIIIPEEKIEQVLGKDKRKEEIKLPNWQGWLKLFFN